MGGFVFNSRNEGIYSVDIMRFEDFPDGITPDGENPNLTLRSYLTTNNGECVPMYEYTGTIDEWTQTLLQAEQAAPGDGNVFKLVEEGRANGGMFLSQGELLIEDRQAKGYAPLDGEFEGVSYNEIMTALAEAGYNKNQNIEPVSHCSVTASNEATPNSTMPTTGMHSKV